MSLVCDVCSGPTARSTSYILTTTQVVSSESYWMRALQDPSMSAIHDLDPQGNYLVLTTQNLVGSPTAWIVCEKCIGLFEVDRKAALKCSITRRTPPGSGPAQPQVAALPLGYAWAKLYKSWPASIQVGGHAPASAPGQGTMCDFCSRVVADGSESVAIVKGEEFLTHFEQVANIGRARPCSRKDTDGGDLYFACGYCVRRYKQGCQRRYEADPERLRQALRDLKTG